MKTHIEILEEAGACNRGLEFAAQFPDMASTIAACDRVDWLRWALRLIADKYVRVSIAAHIVRNTPAGDGRTVCDLLSGEPSRHALDVCDAYVRSEATDEGLRRAAAFPAHTVADAAALHAARAVSDSIQGWVSHAATDAAHAGVWPFAIAVANKWQMAYIKSLDWNRIIHAD